VQYAPLSANDGEVGDAAHHDQKPSACYMGFAEGEYVAH